jgi:tRNA pseudouridine55 synthase
MQEITFSGLLKINKPAGITSYDCIRHIKRILKTKTKIGHAGTLDPFASGLMLICIGRQATKTIDQLMTKDKEYLVKAKLGELTDTLDLTGKVIATQKVDPNLTAQDIGNAIKTLGSSYLQTPPIYSALKYQGEPLHKLAREQKIEPEALEKIIQQKTRQVQIFKIELLNIDLPFFTFKAHVSKGTYIRSLANDIAQQLGLNATTYELVRTAIGNYKLEDSVNLDDLKTVEDINAAFGVPVSF